MTREGIPSDRELYNPVLQALHHFEGSETFGNIEKWIADKLKLSNEQLTVLRNSYNSENDTLFKHRVRFALTHMRKAGYFDNPRRSVWQLSALGRATQRVDPRDVIRRRDDPEIEEGISWSNRRRKPPSAVRLIEDKPITDMVDHDEVVVQIHASDTPNVTHEEIQWLLLSLGNEMGLDLWVARNDRQKSFQDNVFSSLPKLQQTLPIQFDSKSQRIIELIDVLWLQGNSITAAFEIEHTTAIYSGLLRMSDLMTLQPNININLFIVAPDDRREKVKSEIKRPTFAKARLPRVCRYIAYSRLMNRIEQAKTGGFLRYLNPSFLDEIAEDILE